MKINHTNIAGRRLVFLSAMIFGTQLASGQVVLANSETEFSGVQGQDNWTYGYRNFTADGGAENYDPVADFIAFDETTEFSGTAWDLQTAAAAPWTLVGALNVHPNGTNNTNEHWAIRRWTATGPDITGPTLVEVAWYVAAQNPAGNGTSGRLHLNGDLQREVAVGGTDEVGVTTSSFLTVDVGDIIDLALTPEGPTGDRGDGADGSYTRMIISTVVDTDNDLLADSWEEVYFPGDLTQLSAGGDFDNDNLTDGEEFALQSNPTVVDTDGDGLNDDLETNDGVYVSPTETGSSPILVDTDADGINDFDEVNGTPVTDPSLFDTDGDGFSDFDELNIFQSDPTDINDTPLSEALGDSRTEFSGVDGQDGWSWGYRNYTADGGATNYDAAADFIPFPVDGTTTRSLTNFWNGTNYDWFNEVDPQNPPWTLLGREGTHPNGTNNAEEHWTVRRWTASGLGATTPVRVIWHTRKSNTANDGVTGGIHLNGDQLDAQTVAGNDTTGFIRYHYINLEDGDIIDLVLTPEGVTNRTDGSDSASNWMTIDTRVPAVPIHSNGKYFIPVDAEDSEPDGLADFWEEEYFPGDLSQLFTGGDFDGDGLNDEDEQALSTNPTVGDSDGDGISDGAEVALGTDPCSTDSDGDGFSDGHEVATGYDPADANSNVTTSVGLSADLLNDYPEFENSPQGVNGWTYGYYNITVDGEPTSQTTFIEFPTDGTTTYSPTNFWNGANFDMIDGGGQATNPPWTNLTPTTAHPNGDNNLEVHWTTTRWTATEDGPLALSYSLRKQGMGGNGTTAIVLQNGLPLDEITVGGTDGVGLRSWYFVNARAGDTLELALSPKGVDDSDNDGNDNSHLQFWIDPFIPAGPVQPDGTPFVPGVGLDALRVLAVDYDQDNSLLRVTFTSRDGFEYQVEQLSGTDPVSWTPIGPSASPQAGGETTVTIPGFTDPRAIIHVRELVP